MVDFIGRNTSIAGTSSAGVNLDLIYLDQQLYTVNASGITLDFRTLNGKAWYNYLNDYIRGIGTMENNTDYKLTYTSNYATVTLKLYNVSFFNFNRAITQVTLQMS